MTKLSRRRVLLGSVSVVAIACGAIFYAHTGGGMTTSLQLPNKDNPIISLVEVRKTFEPYIDRTITRSEKDFGVKYSEADRERIRTRAWDKIQLVFSEVYNFKEGTQ